MRGRNLAEGVPRSFTLNSDEILEALQEPLSAIVQAVKSALEQSPPELASVAGSPPTLSPFASFWTWPFSIAAGGIFV